ncbi:MAG: hypothetical protein ACLR4A_04185 [Christensenellales bacterium]
MPLFLSTERNSPSEMGDESRRRSLVFFHQYDEFAAGFPAGRVHARTFRHNRKAEETD